MSIIVPDLNMPENCLECMFRVPTEELSVGNGMYKKISHCMFAPDELEDPWHSLQWMLHNKEKYCPLKEVK